MTPVKLNKVHNFKEPASYIIRMQALRFMRLAHRLAPFSVVPHLSEILSYTLGNSAENL